MRGVRFVIPHNIAAGAPRVKARPPSPDDAPRWRFARLG
jgi:hypothetical protein